jgi:hypothetical protein
MVVRAGVGYTPYSIPTPMRYALVLHMFATQVVKRAQWFSGAQPLLCVTQDFKHSMHIAEPPCTFLAAGTRAPYSSSRALDCHNRLLAHVLAYGVIVICGRWLTASKADTVCRDCATVALHALLAPP